MHWYNSHRGRFLSRGNESRAYHDQHNENRCKGYHRSTRFWIACDHDEVEMPVWSLSVPTFPQLGVHFQVTKSEAPLGSRGRLSFQNGQYALFPS